MQRVLLHGTYVMMHECYKASIAIYGTPRSIVWLALLLTMFSVKMSPHQVVHIERVP